MNKSPYYLLKLMRRETSGNMGNTQMFSITVKDHLLKLDLPLFHEHFQIYIVDNIVVLFQDPIIGLQSYQCVVNSISTHDVFEIPLRVVILRLTKQSC